MKDSDSQAKQLQRWPGVLMSFFVPGFGLVRAGQTKRGLKWFGGMFALTMVTRTLFGLGVVPFFVGALAFVAMMGAFIWMLKDSFRPGKMSGKLWLGLLVGLGLMIVIGQIRRQVAIPFKIPTGGMEPTLQGNANGTRNGDYVIVDRWTYRFSKPKRGDIVVFDTSTIPAIANRQLTDDKIYYLKRLIGLPGEEIRVRGGKIHVDGVELTEADGIPNVSYLEMDGPRSAATRRGDAYLVGENEYFVLGDNSGHSWDSRSWGGVPVDSVIGEVSKIYFPFHRAGSVQ